MTESHTRAIPRLLASPARPRPREAPAAQHPVPEPPLDNPFPYDRHGWEQAIRFSELKPDVRLVAMMLAHYASPMGCLGSEAMIAGRLAKACGLRPDDRVRGALGVLERRGYLLRLPAPLSPGGHVVGPRPANLTLPRDYAPPQPGGRP